MQPFHSYDGLLDRQRHAERLESDARLGIELCRILDTNVIQVAANFGNPADFSADKAVIAADLRELAILAKEHGIRLGYEMMASPLPV
jgi:4-hydroxyphenylpyruvate dioxygenase